ncbi:MAG TPA: hypothetical protein VGD39_02670 [Nocardioides sp.]
MTDQLPLGAYALAAAVDRRNGDPAGTCQPMALTAFVVDLRELAREVIARDVVHSDTPQYPR